MGKTHIIGVGLDLGGTYTGTFITSHPSDEAEHRDHSSAFTVVNSEKLSFSSKSRTAVRHRVRSYKGFDLRRRLLLLVAEYQLFQKKQALTPEDFRNLAFSRFPKWIGWLMNFRNAIVKPLGLDTATRFTDMVLDKNLHEEILGMPDKHLDFHVSMWCGEYHEGKQELRITTVVKYNNWLGRAYFFIIRPFHGIIVKSILKHVAGDRGSGCK